MLTFSRKNLLHIPCRIALKAIKREDHYDPYIDYISKTNGFLDETQSTTSNHKRNAMIPCHCIMVLFESFWECSHSTTTDRQGEKAIH